jgi:hypothetical protein
MEVNLMATKPASKGSKGGKTPAAKKATPTAATKTPTKPKSK